MEHQPLITIVTAFLNEEKFLREAVESVLAQSYSNWEYFLVDDGSTDGSTAIAKDYMARYPGKIFYLQHEGHANKGNSASRNLGINHGRGEFICVLDGDDVWHEDKLRDQLGLLLDNPQVGMICGAYEYWRTWNPEGVEEDEMIYIGGPQDQVTDPPLLIKHLYPLGYGSAPCPSDIMLRMDVYKKHAQFAAGLFLGKYQFYEDQAFFVKIYFNVPVYITSKCYLHYRQHSKSLVALAYSEGNYDRARKYFLEWLMGYMKEKNIRQKFVWALYKKAMRPYRTGWRKAYFGMKDKAYRLLYPVIKRIKPAKAG
ncbi:glycosyltransferase family 2 protein [Foetidibacter luteolus]|uniref:glycosyltransferase family 2 protein n=1 Tax=Foetidibacter luteolus TaxID=2608880 RepID=UPI00129A3030|nr:glycosyltransferase family 2 protein [Foetidibacter luteolus]